MFPLKTIRSLALILFSNLLITPILHGSQAAAAAQLLSHESPSSLEERARMASLIDSRLDEVYKKFSEDEDLGFTCQCISVAWLPGYFIKKNTSRIQGAQALMKFIQVHELNLLTVPEKWVHQIPATYQEKGYRNLVISKQIPENTDLGSVQSSINLEQAQQLLFLLTHAKLGNRYYMDTNPGNLLHSSDGRIAIIDTEKSGWSKDPNEGLRNLLEYSHAFTNDARAFLENQLLLTQQDT